MKRHQDWKQRPLYRYTCGKCGLKRVTFKMKKAKQAECGTCTPKEKINPNQTSLL